MAKPTLTIDVTQELIDRSIERDSRSCMIAEAIKTARPDFRRVIVDLATIRWTNPKTKKRYVCLTPVQAGIALVAFDQGQPVSPFTLNLKPVQVTEVTVRERKEGATGRGEKAYTKRTQRGRKRTTASGAIRGGDPLPMGHLSNTRLSRQDVRLYGRRLLQA